MKAVNRHRLLGIVTILMVHCSIALGQLSSSNVDKPTLTYVSPLDILTYNDSLYQSNISIRVKNYKTQPIFCHLEHMMQVKSNIPVRFRLGTVQYVDKLEGKTKYLTDEN